MFGWPFNTGRQREQDVPAWLATALNNAVVTERSQDEDGNPRIMVKVSGLGCWYYSGLRPTADRIARHTDLPPSTCMKAARILADVVASHSLTRARGRNPNRKSWVREALEW